MSPEVSRKPRLVYLNSDVLRSDVDAVVAVSEIERARHVDRLPPPSLVVVAVVAAAVDPDLQRHAVSRAVLGRLQRLEALGQRHRPRRP